MVSSHFEVLSHSIFCSASGDRQDIKTLYVRNWGEERETGADIWLQAIQNNRKFWAGTGDTGKALGLTVIVLSGTPTA